MRATRSFAGIIERVVSVCAWGGFVISHVEITLKDGGYRRADGCWASCRAVRRTLRAWTVSVFAADGASSGCAATCVRLQVAKIDTSTGDDASTGDVQCCGG